MVKLKTIKKQIDASFLLLFFCKTTLCLKVNIYKCHEAGISCHKTI